VVNEPSLRLNLLELFEPIAMNLSAVMLALVSNFTVCAALLAERMSRVRNVGEPDMPMVVLLALFAPSLTIKSKSPPVGNPLVIL